MKYYFYIIQSKRNNKLYLGNTTDLEKRIREHNKGNNIATKPNTPYKLIFYSVFINKEDAKNCEKYFKTTSGWKRINKMLKKTLS